MTAAPPLPRFLQDKPKLAAWYRATRPRVFTASYVPMGVAAAVAAQDGVFRLIPFLLATLGVMLLQTAANLVNEYYDFLRGAENLKQAGQGMVIKGKLLSPREVLVGAVFTTLGGALIGLYFITQSGPLLWGIGLFGVIVAITYTAGPFPLAYNGLGEIAVGIAMGPMIVLGAYYVMADRVYADLVWVSIPVALMVAAILHANNIRDVEADRAVNKRTLVVLLGIRFARAEYAFLVIGTYVALVILVLAGKIPPGTLLALVTLPEAITLTRIIHTETATARLHMAQGRTARLHGRFGFFMVMGWLAFLLIAQ